ncbi:helix-turn-helix transcriptional regulator [Dyella silvae]|uniref:helix-turn-helix transcriptional regulator n=1 Tax=Dyella silvae TaxID=2994424 RepID=UPI002264F57A|nr:AraC family transcriptional regulator [Dyella silvae]
MSVDITGQIQRWSTLDVPENERRDYYAATLSDNLTPMEVVCDEPGPLNAGFISTHLGPITVFRMQGTKHRSLRKKRQLARSTARSINLVINLASEWRFIQRNRMLLRTGDAVLADSLLPFELDHDAYDIVNLQISEPWLRQWIPSPTLLVGRVIPRDVGWGRALSTFVSALSPEVVRGSALPGQVFIDQVGGLLAQVAHELNGRIARPSLAQRALRIKAQSLIVQRCIEQRLSAVEVACALDVPEQAMHAALGACGATFAQILMDARVEQARQLLMSPLLRRITVAEIGHRCGFSDPAYFARAIRKRTGYLPSELRPFSSASTAEHDHAV